MSGEQLDLIVRGGRLSAALDLIHAASGLPFTLRDAAGAVLLEAGQDHLCSRFPGAHRSGTAIGQQDPAPRPPGLPQDRTVMLEGECGVWSAARAIVQDGRHLATLHSGHFCLPGEAGEPARLRAWATELGFDPEEYRLAVGRLPRMALARTHRILDSGAEFIAVLLAEPMVAPMRSAVEKSLLQARQEAERANRELEFALMRTQELTLEAQTANTVKNEFLANMSHELRTPLNAVIGMVSILQESGLTTAQREQLRIIRSAGDTLLSLVDDLLDFSRLEARVHDLVIIDCDLRVAVDGALRTLAYKAHEKGLEFSHDYDPGVLSLIRADPGRLRQVLNTVAGNAIKFTEHGRVTVRTCLDAETDSHATVRFTVTDTGIGIPAARLDRLFRPFSQVDGSSTRRHGGTGIGLLMAKRLIEAMGGEIGLVSEEGKGTTLWFTVVVEKPPPQPVVAPPRAGCPRAKYVLLVDNSLANREVMQLQLYPTGCRTAEATSATDALAALRTADAQGDPFDLVITDSHLPEGSGVDFGRMVKANDCIAGTKLILLATAGRRGDAALAQEAGFRAYLTRPVRPEHLRRCVGEVLAGAQDLITKYSLVESRKQQVRILIADDNPVNRKIALTSVRKLGYHADAVADGRAAVAAAEDSDYDLILMDMEMPEMNGLAATRAIRRLSGNRPRPAIIAVTGSTSAADRQACLASGMDDFLTKPINPLQIAETIERQLSADAPGDGEEPGTELAA